MGPKLRETSVKYANIRPEMIAAKLSGYEKLARVPAGRLVFFHVGILLAAHRSALALNSNRTLARFCREVMVPKTLSESLPQCGGILL
jgi:hypothetical protein